MLPRPMLVAVALAVCLPGATPLAERAGGLRSQDPGAQALVARAAQYVAEYEARVTGLVGEERSTQRIVTANGSVAKVRRLVSDVIFLNAADRSLRTLVFREVIAVDGRPERDRQGRLERLFGTGRDAVGQARAILDESARYDLEFPHLGSVLTLPLFVVKLGETGQFRFQTADGGVTFDEVRSPTVVLYQEGRRVSNVPIHGRLSLDAATGALRSATVRGMARTFEATVDTRFAEDPELGLLVPVDMRETYSLPSRPKEDRLEIATSYANFRRFDVRTDEAIALQR